MLKKIFGCMLTALFVIAAIVPVNASEVPQMEEKFGEIKLSDLESGWVANIYAFSRGENVTTFPPASMGSFKAQGSGAMVNDYEKSLGFPIKNKSIGWQGQAYIVAEKKGYYVLMMNTKGYDNYGVIFVNDKEIIKGYEDTGTIVGNVELEPGVHLVEFKYATRVDRRLAASGGVRKDCGFELRIKSPTDNAPVPAAQVLFRKK